MGEMIISYGGEWDIVSIKKGKRFIIIKISNGAGLNYNIVNLHAQAVYANLRGAFFEEIMEILILDRDKTIILGDFNVVLDPIDRIGTGRSDEMGKKELIKVIQALDTKDAFRALHPHTLEYTFRMIVRGGNESKARLDRIYVPSEMEIVNIIIIIIS